MKLLNLHIFFILLTNIGFTQSVIDKSDKDRPAWISGNTNIESKSFQYIKGMGASTFLDEARKFAFQDFLIDYAQTIEQSYTVNSKNKATIDNIFEDGEVKTISDFVLYADIQGKEQEIKIHCLSIVEYYWEKELVNGKPQYQYWILVRIPNDKNDCNLDFYKSYGKFAVWRSVLIPGWGQLYKKEKAKGMLVLSSTVLTVSGIIVSQTMYKSNINNASATHDIDLINAYLENADSWQKARNIFSVAAGAIYIYNLIDAMTAEGEKQYTLNTPHPFELLPMIADNSIGISVYFNF